VYEALKDRIFVWQSIFTKMNRMRYRCLVVDDSLLERDKLQILLEQTGLVDIIASCADGMEAWKILSATRVDIVFSDISMPLLSGLDLVKSLQQQPVFVFVSSHTEYAAESFDLDIADFIVKPVQFNRLLKAVTKAIQRIPVVPDQSPTASPADDYLLIRADEKLNRILIRDIIYIQSAGNFCKVFTIDGMCYLTLVNLKNFMAQLNAGPIAQVHRQYAVNRNFVISLDTVFVTLGKDIQIPVSAQYRDRFIHSLSAQVIVRTPSV